jgi:transcriptional regulator with XRE-family HTH domain
MASREELEATHVMGEIAASRLFSLIHERLEELKEEKGLTQAQVAGRLGVSEQLVSRWLAEPRNITVKAAGRLLAALEAGLLFDLDRFEDIARSNAAPASRVHPPISRVEIQIDGTPSATATGTNSVPTTIVDIARVKLLADA